MKKIWQVVGLICGILMFAFSVYWFLKWWGLIGGIIIVVLFPLEIIFPFIYLFKEGFSLFYFAIWGLQILSGIILAVSGKEETPTPE